MFKTNNEKIGKHLGDLIKKSEYKPSSVAKII